MSKHTPGPWTLETVQTQSGICHKVGPFPWKNGKQNHACIYADYPGLGPAEKELEANANLIAAAPDLLEALEKLVILAGDRLSIQETYAMRDLLATAKGESQ